MRPLSTLKFLNSINDIWKLSLLVIYDNMYDLTISGEGNPTWKELENVSSIMHDANVDEFEAQDVSICFYELSFTRHPTLATIGTYTLRWNKNIFSGEHRSSETYEIQIPAIGAEIRMMFFSGNKLGDMMRKTWSDSLNTVDDLIVCTGNLIYADDIFDQESVIRAITSNSEVTANLLVSVTNFYISRYIDYLLQCREMAKKLASTPMISLPGEHDIFDGCGSHSESISDDPVYDSIKEIAFNCYKIVCHHCYNALPTSMYPKGDFTRIFTIDDTRLYVIDTLSKRTPTNLLPDEYLRGLRAENRSQTIIITQTSPISFASGDEVFRKKTLHRTLAKIDKYATYSVTDDIWSKYPVSLAAFFEFVEKISPESKVSIFSGGLQIGFIAKYRGIVHYTTSNMGVVPNANVIAAYSKISGKTVVHPRYGNILSVCHYLSYSTSKSGGQAIFRLIDSHWMPTFREPTGCSCLLM